ncbi:hypothetical protein, partial [Thiocapsa sp.]|uniref:hypothetical protein n=1 Tax=Thiocapsa sp. TaxID=2024551 RepID=UPI0035946542
MSNPIPHPQGEPETTALVPHAGPVAVDTLGGRVHVEWDAQAAVTRWDSGRSSPSSCARAGVLMRWSRAAR